MNQLLVPKNQSGIHLKTFLMQWGLSASYWKALKKARALFVNGLVTVWDIPLSANDRGSFPFLPEETALVPEEGPSRFYMKMRFSLPFIRSKDCLSTTAALPKSLPYPAVFSSITGNMALKPPFIRFRGSTVKQAALSYLPKTPHSIICSLRPP